MMAQLGSQLLSALIVNNSFYFFCSHIFYRFGVVLTVTVTAVTM